jgi:cob(I)alamin adenosyltransferase
MKGYIQVYTGNGKGKTTAALGLTLRACGAGKRVLFAQFIKGGDYAEIEAIRRFLPMVTLRQYGLGRFIKGAPHPDDVRAAAEGLRELTELIPSGGFDVVVLDEANVALHCGLFTQEELLGLLRRKPEGTEIVLTGRHAVPEIVEMADLVTEMREVKHYFHAGVPAREGIEF